jgi:hypothetical protein
LWSFVSLQKTAEACLLAITLPLLPASESSSVKQKEAIAAPQVVTGADEPEGAEKGVVTGWGGHETFFIAARTTCQQSLSSDLVRQRYSHITDLRFKGANGDTREMSGNEALIDTSKAERLLGWKDEGYPWCP